MTVWSQQEDKLPTLDIPPGLGLRAVPRSDWYPDVDPGVSPLIGLMDRLLVWELPRRGQRYVLGVDVSDGVGLDRSVVDVLRVGTLTETDEQVAQYVSNSVDAIDLAHIIDPIGRFYADQEGAEALAAIECNNHGLATQSELQRHLGYQNFFVWQYWDKRDVKSSYSNTFGWYTNRRTRPIILARYTKALKTVDPVTGFPDYRINSPFTIEELADFQTEGALWEAAAADGAHDDCVMAGAISVHVAQTLHFDEREPLADARRRHAEEKIRRTEHEERLKVRRDFINTDMTAEEMNEELEGF